MGERTGWAAGATDSLPLVQHRFRISFAEFSFRYDIDNAPRLRTFRLQRISTAARRFIDWGDYTDDAARMQRTNLN